MVVVAVLPALATPPAEATFPGRNGEILYTVGWASRYENRPSALEAVGPRTGRIRELGACATPRCQWTDVGVSPDGQRLGLLEVSQAIAPAYSYEIVITDLQGRVESRGTAPQFSQGRLRWSPEGSRILVKGLIGGVPQLTVLGLDGTPLQVAARGDDSTANLSTEWGGSYDWSRSDRLAFVGTVPAGCFLECRQELFVARPGETPRRITRRGATGHLSWSPNGRWIAFTKRTRDDANGLDVFIVRGNGTGLRRITRRSGRAPTWSPDGKRIAFLRRGVLYTTTPKGTHLDEVTRIANDLGPTGEGRYVTALDWAARP